MEKNHIEQARLWLKSAAHTSSLPSEGTNKYSVAVSMAIHAIIKANDALTFRYLNTTARKHDDARRLFEDLIKKNIIKQEYAPYAQIIQDAINNKAKAEYRGSYFSKKDFQEMERKAERFIKMVECSI